MLLALPTLLSAPAPAQQPTYPSRPVRIIVPFQAGSSTDVFTRALAGALTAHWGQPVVVENKAGAEGAIGAAEVARAAPDGHTLLMASNSPMAGVPALKRKPPYDVRADFTPITAIGRYTFFLVAHPQLQVGSVADLVRYAKAHPNQLNYATGNTTGILTIAQLSAQTGIELTHVPYKGEPNALVDLLAGRVQLMVVSAGQVLQHIKEGRLRALATTLPQASPALPEVPPLAAAGVPNFSLVSWAALFGPAKLPSALVEQINAAFGDAMNRADVKQAFDRQAFLPRASTPDQLADFVSEQIISYRDAARSAGIEPD